MPTRCERVGEQQVLNETNLRAFLHSLGLIEPDEPVQVEKAGDGNINWVRRVRVGEGARSFVVKQARPALERFPQYRASTERIAFEALYYRTVHPVDHERVCPAVLAFSESERVLVLEDLGSVPRMDALGPDAPELGPTVARLARFLAGVHRHLRGHPVLDRFTNEEMKTLHGDHIFELPLRPNDFPLPEAVRRRADALRRDAELVAVADRAYRRFRASRETLVHGDVQAGNVLVAERGAVLLDAEISHAGDPAFDVGVLAAHLLIPSLGRVDGRLRVQQLWEIYTAAHGVEGCPSFSDVARYAGLEMLRRTLGAARLPALEDEATALLAADVAVRLIRQPASRPAEVPTG